MSKVVKYTSPEPNPQIVSESDKSYILPQDYQKWCNEIVSLIEQA